MHIVRFCLIWLSLAAGSLASASDRAVDFNASATKARAFFLESTEQSLVRVKKAEHPIQTDLYILVHFLMHNDSLKFTSDTALASKLNGAIVDYLLSLRDTDVIYEGCLLAKILIALANKPQYREAETLFASRYKTFINRQWGSKGIGECFVSSIERSYGNNTGAMHCTPPTQELEAKTAYYLSTSKIHSPKTFRTRFNTLNEIRHETIDDWWKANVELWVISAYHMEDQKMVGKKRYQHAVKLVNASIENPPENTMILSLISQAYLADQQKPDPRIFRLLEKIARTQKENGAIPSLIADPKKSSHNFDATPTYMYLLALRAALEYPASGEQDVTGK